MNIEEFLFWESSRRDAYFELAECYKLPDNELTLRINKLEQVFQPLGSDALYQIIVQCAANLEQLDVQTLKVDFSQLFIGPYNLLAPPYGSVYLEGKRKIMGDSTMDILRRYTEVGLTTSENFKDIPDHIRAELEFMHFLIFKEIEATRKEDVNDFTNFLNNQQSFLEQHLCAWISDFADKVANNAQTSFYQNLARATEAFVKNDYLMVSSILCSWQSNVGNPVELTSLQTE